LKGTYIVFSFRAVRDSKADGKGIQILDRAPISYSEYKFAVTMEHVTNDIGYVTEKVFDALEAGAIPIYSGASQIHQLLQKDRFFFMENISDAEATARQVVDILNNRSSYNSMFADMVLKNGVVSDAVMRRFFSWHPAVWPTHGDALRHDILVELAKLCK